MTQEIYGWHIIHTPTGTSHAFCLRLCDGVELTEEDVWEDFNEREFTLVPLVIANGTH